MNRLALLTLALLGASSHADNTADHAQPRPPSTVKAQVTTITETTVTTTNRDGTSTSTQNVHTGEPVLMTSASSAESVLPPPQQIDNLDLSATHARLVQYHAALARARNLLHHGSDADALARYASQAEALAAQAGLADSVTRYRHIRATAGDLQFAIDRKDNVKARALLRTLEAQLR